MPENHDAMDAPQHAPRHRSGSASDRATGRVVARPRAASSDTADLVACPEYECGSPASVLDRYVLESTDGPLEHLRVRCPAGHYFNMPIFMLRTCG